MPRALRKKLKRLFLGSDEKLARVWLPSLIKRKGDPRHYLSVVGFIKDEAEYVEEWIDFHLTVGCDHFFLYDNGSTDRTLELLRPYQQNGRATVMPWPDFTQQNHQDLAYAHAVATFGPLCRWMMLIDIDEFAVPTQADCLKAVLRDYEDLPAIAIPWIMFGFSGHKTKPPGLVISNYTMRAGRLDGHFNARKLFKFKSVLDPTRITGVGTHMSTIDEGNVVYTFERQRLTEHDRSAYSPPDDTPIVINHYFSRSEEEFHSKLQKNKFGQNGEKKAQMTARRRRAIVAVIEGNSVKDTRIQRFVPRMLALRQNQM